MLGVELVFLGKDDADRLGTQQRQQLFLVGEVGAGVVAERVAADALDLGEHRFGLARLFGSETQLAADALVQILGKGLGHLDR